MPPPPGGAGGRGPAVGAGPGAAATPAGGVGGSSASDGGGGGGLCGLLESLLERLPPAFVMLDLEARAAPLLRGASAPFVLVAYRSATP